MAEELMKSGDEVRVSEEVKNLDSKEMVVIDIKDDEKVTTSSNSNPNSEKVCRICLVPSPEAMIIALGCNCRGEIGFSHPRCASTWFSFRGNTKCEICGKIAKNIQYSSGLVRERREVEVEVEVVNGGCFLNALVFSWFLSLSLCYIFTLKGAH